MWQLNIYTYIYIEKIDGIFICSLFQSIYAQGLLKQCQALPPIQLIKRGFFVFLSSPDIDVQHKGTQTDWIIPKAAYQNSPQSHK